MDSTSGVDNSGGPMPPASPWQRCCQKIVVGCDVALAGLAVMESAVGNDTRLLMVVRSLVSAVRLIAARGSRHCS